MDCFRSFHDSSANPYELLFTAATLIPVWHYLLGFLIISYVFLYNYLDFHFWQDFFTGFRGSYVDLTYNSNSHIYHGMVSKCRVLHARYLATPWLASPHLQTLFLNFFGNTPEVTYQREFFRLSDGGTIALDWAAAARSHIFGGGLVPKDDSKTPIVVVLPGLTSDSDSAYVRHLAFNTAKMGWNVVISNHRGLGGVPLTSDFIYNCGWTDDIREVSNHLHHKHPKAPLFLIGTSIGANILVKYLGEDGNNVPVAGAAAICNPWDFLIGDRFIQRTLLQKLYDKALTKGLQCSIYVCNVAVPLLCISALDDPICTRESIPWDECRNNVNVVLATTKHGGHLAFFEGFTCSGIWWVSAVDEFFKVLNCSKYMHVKKNKKIKSTTSGAELSLDSSIPRVAEDGIGVVFQLVKVAAFVKGVAFAKVVAQNLGMGA
ncbi:hypothetical protein COP1_022371 [Malus domestica]